MSAPRESRFPASSIGRASGAAMHRSPSPSPSLTTASRESLTAHPLLSPSHSPPPPVSISTMQPISTADASNSSPTASARYATYTPRHRTAATTSTTLQGGVTVPPQHQQGATSKLQLMNLKAYAQSVGLETGSVGWEMLERLTADHEHGLEWTEIWNALTAGKVCHYSVQFTIGA